MEQTEAAILRTVLYADVFNFPMTAVEIHHFLIADAPASLKQIQATLAASARLREILHVQGDYIIYGGRDELIGLREAREQASQHLWPLARRYGIWLARLPFVRMVALTGALAVRNAASGDDDLDYMIVTAPHRVWLARAFAVVLVRLGRLQGVEICPNYLLAETALEQERHDIFIAHEVAQMVPLYGHALYHKLRAENSWVRQYLPNADGVFHAESEGSIGTIWAFIKRLLENVFTGRIGNILENWEYRRKLRRFNHDMQKPHSSAKLDSEQVKGHFNDHGHPVLQKYYQRLREYGLTDEAVAVPGD
jgi:hypothetical protein